MRDRTSRSRRGGGTGKTTLLVARIVRGCDRTQVRARPARRDHLHAKRRRAQLRSRLRDEIRSAIAREAGGGPRDGRGRSRRRGAPCRGHGSRRSTLSARESCADSLSRQVSIPGFEILPDSGAARASGGAVEILAATHARQPAGGRTPSPPRWRGGASLDVVEHARAHLRGAPRRGRSTRWRNDPPPSRRGPPFSRDGFPPRRADLRGAQAGDAMTPGAGGSWR